MFPQINKIVTVVNVVFLQESPSTPLLNVRSKGFLRYFQVTYIKSLNVLMRMSDSEISKLCLKI